MAVKMPRKILVSLIAVLLLISSTLSVNAAYTGIVYMFTYNASSLPNYFNDYRMSTRKDAQLSLPWLWKMNYDAGEYLNNSVVPLASVMPNASILTVGTHGMPGRIYCPDPHSEYAPRMTELTGKDVWGSEYYSIPVEYMNLSRTKLVIYTACYSGSWDKTYGNLVNETHDAGADAVVGWKDAIPMEILPSHWMGYFFEACYFLHCDVQTAARTASNRLKMEFPNAADSQAVEAMAQYLLYGNATIY
ncbi:MAG: hypothetical protein HFJ80_05325 [Clostridiales bacterium]|nr:hypothetical protein [Clostridiales bacterium]